LYEQNVREAAFDWPAVNFFGDLLQGTTIRVDADKECTWVTLRTLVDKEAVSGPDVSSYSSFVRSNEFVKSCSIDLSGGLTSD